MGVCFKYESASWQVDILCIWKVTNEPAHGKLVLITKINNEDLDETVHLCMLISVIEYECDSTHTLRPDKQFQRNLSKNTVM